MDVKYGKSKSRSSLFVIGRVHWCYLCLSNRKKTHVALLAFNKKDDDTMTTNTWLKGNTKDEPKKKIIIDIYGGLTTLSKYASYPTQLKWSCTNI